MYIFMCPRRNQARLQRNLMYLAAIADSQPQPSPLHAQFLPPAAMQGARYLQHQQAQQMTPSSLAAARSSMMYGQQPLSALQQQSMHSQLGMSSGVNSGFHLLNSETGMGGNGALTAGSFSDFGRNNGDGFQAATRSLMGGGKQDGGHVSSSEGRGSQSADGTEALYLKGNEEGN
eukprot:TRINITY_DN30744_c1_g1_i2.p1 TRINITY_DN30744_c1_g1~~TRINITY_DN30744_c1_g1_i2.p1  ORF type:complete len:175 (-),score=45.74 TRINITY_DN30744_c1_g1_i2:238-762(-)